MFRKNCIHQTWKNSRPPADQFRKSWIESWERLNPDWSYRLWDDLDMAAFVRDEFPRFFPIWCRYPQAIMRVDSWRYLLLKKVGGLYVDLDFACLRPLEEWLPTADRFSVADQGNSELCNAFMWAPSPHLPFFEDIEIELKLHAQTGHVLSATGPGFLTQYARGREDLIERIPTEMVYPLPFWAYDDCKSLGDLPVEEVAARLPDAGAITFWSHSWASQEDTKPVIPPRKRPEWANAKGNEKVLVVCLTRQPSHDGDLEWLDEAVDGIEVRRVNVPAGPDGLRKNHEVPAERIEALIEELSMELHYDWFFICTDQTYVVLDRIRDLVDAEWDGICSGDIETDGKIDLKAGVLLSRQAITKLREIPRTGSRTGFEDALGQIYAEGGILWKSTSELHGDAYQIPLTGNDLVTAYVSTPKELNLVHAIFSSEPQCVIPTAHPGWCGELVFFESGLFVRGGGGGFGTWESFQDAMKLLMWSSGVQELFMPLSSAETGCAEKGILLSMDNARYLFPS